MVENTEYMSLNWVKSEIDETLKQARNALESYVEDPEDTQQLGACIMSLHQVSGTLQVVELYGAALLAEEMEHLADAIVHDRVRNREDACEILVSAMLQLPDYLERVQAGQRDMPVVLLPLLNDIRATRGLNLLSEGAFFSPDLSVVPPSPPPAEGIPANIDLRVVAHKLRPVYQSGLVGWFRDIDRGTSLKKLAFVLDKLHCTARTEATLRFWWVATGVVQALGAEALDSSPTLKLLLGHIDGQIKLLASEGESFLAAHPDTDLLKNLLYYVAKAKGGGTRVEQLQEAFRLKALLITEDELSEARQRLGGPNLEVMRSVSKALREDLASVKDSLDLFVRSDDRKVERLRALNDTLRQISDTLAMLGLGAPRNVIQEQMGHIERMLEDAKPVADSSLMDIAGALLYVEASLGGLESGEATAQPSEQAAEQALLPEPEVRQLRGVVIKEAIADVTRAKDAIVGFITAPYQHDLLAEIPQLFAQIRGALSMLVLERAAKLIEACGEYIARELLEKRVTPSQEELDALADAITGVEYYLEGIGEGRANVAAVLDVADRRLAELGYAVTETGIEGPEEAAEGAAVASLRRLALALDRWLADSVDATACQDLRDTVGRMPAVAESETARQKVAKIASDVNAMVGLICDGRGDLTDDIANTLRLAHDTLSRILLGEEVGGEEVAAEEEISEQAAVKAQPVEAPPAADEAPEQATAEAEPVEALLAEEEVPEQAEAEPVEAPPAEEEVPAHEVAAEGAAEEIRIEAALPVEQSAAGQAAGEQGVAAAPPGASEAPPAGPEVDDEIIEIFLEEADEELATIAIQFPKWRADSTDTEALKTFRRSFHTLKGSGRLVGARAVGELAWACENMLNRVIDGAVFPCALIYRVLEDAQVGTRQLLEHFRGGSPPTLDISALERLARRLSEPGGEQAVLAEESAAAKPAAESGPPRKSLAPEAAEQGVELEAAAVPEPEVPEGEGLAPEAALSQGLVAAEEQRATAASEMEFQEPAVELELGEAEEVPAAEEPLSEGIEAEEMVEEVSSFELEEAAEEEQATESFRLEEEVEEPAVELELGEAEEAPVAEEPLSEGIEAEEMVEEVSSFELEEAAEEEQATESFRLEEEVEEPAVELELGEAEEALATEGPSMGGIEVEEMAEAGELELQGEAAPGEQVTAKTGAGEIDPVLLEIFIKEANEHMATVRAYLEECGAPHTCQATEALIRAVHTLRGSAHMAGITGIAALSGELEKWLRALRDSMHPFGDADLALLTEATRTMERMLGVLEGPRAPMPTAEELVTRTAEAAHEAEQRAAAAPAVEEHLIPETPPSPEVLAAQSGEVVGLFVDEALDILDASEGALTRLREAPEKEQHIGVLQRELHTLKGSAQLAGFAPIADLGHAMEDAVNRIAAGQLAADPGLLDLFQRVCDRLVEMLHRVYDSTPVHPAADLLAELQAAGGGEAEDRPPPYPEKLAETPPLEETTTNSVPEQQGADLRNIFLSEAEEIMRGLQRHVEDWDWAPDQLEPVEGLRRELYTLRGGAGLAQVNEVAELGNALEALCSAILEDRVSGDDQPHLLLRTGLDTLGGMLAELREGRLATPARDLVKQLTERTARPPGEPTGEGGAAPFDKAGEEWSETALVETAVGEAEAPAAETPAVQVEQQAPVELLERDPELVAIFLEEGQEILDATDEALNRWRLDPEDDSVVELLQRSLHTLKGSSRMAGIPEVGDLSHSLESVFQSMVQGRLAPTDQVLSLVHDAYDGLVSMLEQLKGEHPVEPAADLITRLGRVLQPAAHEVLGTVPTEPPAETGVVSESAAPAPERDPELVQIFLEEGQDILDATDEVLRRWRGSPEDTSVVESLQRSLHTLKGSSRMAGLQEVGDLSHRLESLFQAVVQERVSASEGMLDLVNEAYDALVVMLDRVRAGQSIAPARDLIARLEILARGEAGVPRPETLSVEAPAPLPMEAAAAPERDPELVEIFLEEGQEILDATDGALQQWRNTPENGSVVESLQRSLHTLKGSSRMAGIPEVGDLSHRLESLFQAIAQGRVEPSQERYELVQAAYDRLVEMLGQVRENRPAEPASDLISRLAETLGEQPPTAPAPVAAVAQAARAAPPRAAGGRVREAEPVRRAPQELVRVRADLLDNLGNFAGEISISRSRMDEQVTGFKQNLVEMEQTVTRLRDQLRRFEIETEAQILFRYEGQTDSEDEEFDPLELDRFSQMQQLSRSLLESLGDLSSIRETLGNHTRETETLLVQQSRVNTELHQGVMRTRMVPFAGLVPRLRRIVRQVSAELGKRVELRVVGAEGEIDRTVLDRMVGPMEHMLRNAIDHGIETPDERRQKGKPETGIVTLRLGREGSEVVIVLSDDGKGINLDAVRRKALDRGLMAEGARLTDNEVMQFILEAGFSTAYEVTQISGRGVGMDVVNSEIKQLNGALRIDSAPGTGSRFTVRLPLTLSTSQALMVQECDDLFAVPLTAIDGIVRIPGEDMRRFQGPEAEPLSYAGLSFSVLMLSQLLNLAPAPLEGGKMASLMLVRTGDHRVAVHVDALLGSREIVVKPVGPQLSTVRGISGATIMGDGRVVLILDVTTLARLGIARQRVAPTEAEEVTAPVAPEKAKPLIMVVDDSITVRKVTARLLERHAMDVVAAKDGVDAVAQLQETIPDVMLLDIEMPRMDGYELATLMRNSERLKEIPIIMITSRTGEKHRERAMGIGVDTYLGKPYQEGELLENISRLLAGRQ